MAGFLFWNLFGRGGSDPAGRAEELCSALTRLLGRHPVDVLVFAECEVEPARLGRALNDAGQGPYTLPPSRSRRIQVWTRLPAGGVVDRYNGQIRNAITVREVRFPGADSILLVGAHLRDRMTVGTEAGRALATGPITSAIRRVERDHDHARTVLVGDLNMNPYEAGMVGTQGLHAVMTRDLARAVGGLTARERYPCFYNPMWACFGDQSPGPPGTFYYPNAEEPTNHFWQLYDQVLVRPELAGRFRRVEILAGDGQQSFLTRTGRPRAESLSDHLPLFFELDLGTI